MLSKKVFKSGYEVSKNNVLAGKENNDCFVRACANAFDISYNTAHNWVGEVFDRKKGKGTKGVRPKMKTINSVMFPVEGQLDLFSKNNDKKFKIKHIGDMPKLGGKLKNRKYTHKAVAYTVKEFIQKFKKGTYLLLVNKHALTVKNGVMIDNNDMQFGGYRRVVETAFQVK